MTTVDVIKCCLDSIRQISDDIKDAIIYLDAGSSESFQFLGAFPLFLELGAQAVCSLENMSSLDKVADWNTSADPARKIVFITSRLLSDAHRYILRCLSMLQNVQKCAIYTSISEVFHLDNCLKFTLLYFSVLTNNNSRFGVALFAFLALDIRSSLLALMSGAETYVCSLSLVHCCSQWNVSYFILVSHSAYPDSPLGPDAFREYESLLNQDYEELVKKRETDPSVSGNSKLKESIPSEDEGWSELTSVDDDISGFDGISIAKLPQEDFSVGYSEDIGKKLMVSVHHFPLILCPFSPRVFVLPSEGSVAEACLSAEHENSISSGLPPLSTGKLTDTEDISPGATLTAQFLYHLALKMDLKLEIFSLGDLSKNVGNFLTDMSSLYDVGRRKRSAGLLLVDRTLDLLTPCCHGDSLVDRMFSSLPRRRRITTLSHTKDSHSQLKNSPVKLERAPLDVQIPLEKFIREDDPKSNFQLLESIEAFLNGWNSSDSDTQGIELMKLSKKLNNECCSQHTRGELLHGSFVCTDNFRGAPYLEAVLDRRTKDGAMLIKKWLQESLRRENISLDVKIRPGFASKSELPPLVKALAKRQSSLVKNKGIIQLAAATLHALDELHSASWDAFSSAEKILNVNAADTSQSLAAQISDLINKAALVASQVQKHNKMEKPLGIFTLQDALLLTVIGYVLAGEYFPTSSSDGPFSWQEEHFMKEAIVDAILENPSIAKLKFLKGLSEELEANLNKTKSDEKKENSSDGVDFDDDQWGNWGDDDYDADREMSKEKVYDDMQMKLELRDRVDNFFKFLHKLSSVKRNTALREIQQNDDPYSSKGLLYKLLMCILDKHDIPGLEYHSSTVGRLFKSGFGRFGLGQAKPSLVEQNVILIFVIGGINGVEVREVQEALTGSSRPDVELIFGGTTFLTPDDMREMLLGDYSYI
ncbi:hypothetical protein BUALT_Bualt03G0185700 [Buddleja alternifolia]|uniref:Sec1 family domain-containing protein MIP3 n=1 Tax=Buddleja alternifolia TaxID=168488 RepID=A0AAV6Y3F1_9LAMI|nr:hypothetical protein BUALT_Bualt03G0185700 [Buddleja alternifolia]